MNEGLISSERSAAFAMPRCLQHPAVEGVFMNGGETATFPAMTCMSRVVASASASSLRRGVASPGGQQPLGMFDRMQVNRWWSREVAAFFREMPQDWMPFEARPTDGETQGASTEALAESATAAE